MPFNKEAYIRYKIIDECLTNRFHQYPTMDDIVGACEEKLGKTFSVSAIQKDIKAMKEDEAIGFLAPIQFSRQHNGYYYKDENYSIHGIPLNSSELESLEAVADILTAFTGSRISDNFNQAVQKIHTSLKEKNLQLNKKRRIIQADAQVRHKGFEHFETFLHAITNKIPVCFIHYSYIKRSFNSVIAHPVLLKEFQNNWYVVAYSENHCILRTFGLDRIYDPLLMKKSFNSTPKEVVDDYFKNIYGVYPLPGAEKQIIQFRTDPLFADYIKAHSIHESQRIYAVSEHGSIIFELNLIPSQELVNFFVQFSEHIFVLRPLFVKNIVKATLKKSIANYND